MVTARHAASTSAAVTLAGCAGRFPQGHGTRWWPAFGDEPKSYDPPTPEWADAATPPWLLSPQSARDACVPFGEAGAGLQTVCCGAMIKYLCVPRPTAAGFLSSPDSRQRLPPQRDASHTRHTRLPRLRRRD
eukprot:5556250-Prymnesium_polylepis.3